MTPGPIQPVFRKARDSDAPACAEIYRDARRAAFHWEDRDYALEEFAGSTYGEALWVAEAGGPDTGLDGNTDGSAGVLAFASVWRAPEYWFLHNLFVAPAWQGRGIGSALLSEVLAAIGRPVELKTDTPNTGARRLYERFGFAVVEEGTAAPTPWFKMRLE
ncbi:GNAT family N-acetyltransferase [Pelagibius sp.]|uniref:GNAT family N-acetyltransferase n=1 Tax=Pelagibius sp. TaxID=1931238 RepID=UPI003B50CF0A